jgi:hypothetical protein
MLIVGVVVIVDTTTKSFNFYAKLNVSNLYVTNLY